MSPSSNVPTLRPVTPLGIIARNLTWLVEQAQSLSDTQPQFAQTLRDTMQLACGLDDYLAASSTPPSPLLAELARDAAHHDWGALFRAGATSLALEAEMVSGHLEGQLLKMLIGATRANRVLEIGLFAGYSALAMAEALPADGELVACEIDAYAASYAQQWFDRSPHGGRITVHVAPAIETLARLRDAGERFDFVFIDADKGQYRAYLDCILSDGLLAENGLICVDNTLMQGEPYLQRAHSPNGRAIAEFNAFVAADPRIDQVLLPVRDGLTLIRRAGR